ncbi:MAG: ABC transporter permease [Verrucomicrobiaceae bacterium]|nr:MAG: ABC transporter permease [Verrucomicrobiaceae bacterium]
MNPNIIYALVSRYVLLYTRNPVRLVELFFWPIVQLLVWGFLTSYLQGQGGGNFPKVITFLIGGIILWDALFRSQQGVAISFLEDVWTRNLLNVFAAPVRMTEYLAATFVVGLLRVFVTTVVMIVIAWFAYSFNLFQFKVSLILFYVNLMLFGWCLGVLVTALILRYGHGAESLAWAIPFMIQPVAAVFYPVSALPSWLQPLAHALPPSHVFEGMRHILTHGGTDWKSMAVAFGLNVFYLTLAGCVFSLTLRTAKKRGLLVKVSSS